MKPTPVRGYLSSLEEESTSQKEESCGGNDNCIASDVTWNQCTNKHHICISSNQRGKEDHPEVKEIAFEMKHESSYCSKCETLNGEKWEIDNEGGNDIRRSTISIVGSLSDEDESFLDKSWYSIIRGKEDKAHCKDVEVEKPVDVFEIRMAKIFEKGRQDECHDSQYNLTRQK
ncbi:TPR repeat-containing thioredoxin TDX [Quillaja saponaria]|uniref:TPR repeat-containing thioredoxin TDX n=1 Tax=Quillaja saponaria TaxID=32244 RepID=A0AAD7Q5K5_QUISA|nr:TPR repeat-containing thioredoxin TDX [Quillaja saponaria]